MDPKDGVATGFRDKRLQRSDWLRVKEGTGDRDLGHILFQDRRGLCWLEARALRTQVTSL
jgi:hypothetical protein